MYVGIALAVVGIIVSLSGNEACNADSNALKILSSSSPPPPQEQQLQLPFDISCANPTMLLAGTAMTLGACALMAISISRGVLMPKQEEE
jgi:hypothetical protein